LIHAVWQPDSKACAPPRRLLGFIAEKHRFILFGTILRAALASALASVLLVLLWLLSAWRSSGNGGSSCCGSRASVIGSLMWGLAGLPYVENERWAG